MTISFWHLTVSLLDTWLFLSSIFVEWSAQRESLRAQYWPLSTSMYDACTEYLSSFSPQTVFLFLLFCRRRVWKKIMLISLTMSVSLTHSLHHHHHLLLLHLLHNTYRPQSIDIWNLKSFKLLKRGKYCHYWVICLKSILDAWLPLTFFLDSWFSSSLFLEWVSLVLLALFVCILFYSSSKYHSISYHLLSLLLCLSLVNLSN